MDIISIFKNEFNLSTEDFYFYEGKPVLKQPGCRAIATKLGLQVSPGEVKVFPFVNGKEGERIENDLIYIPFKVVTPEGKTFENMGSASFLNTKGTIGQNNIMSMAFKRGFCKTVIMAAEDYLRAKGYQIAEAIYSDVELDLLTAPATSTIPAPPLPMPMEAGAAPIPQKRRGRKPKLEATPTASAEEMPLALEEPVVPEVPTPVEEIPEEVPETPEVFESPVELETLESPEVPAEEPIEASETIEETAETEENNADSDPYELTEIVREDLGGFPVPEELGELERYVLTGPDPGHKHYGKSIWELFLAKEDKMLAFVASAVTGKYLQDRDKVREFLAKYKLIPEGMKGLSAANKEDAKAS